MWPNKTNLYTFGSFIELFIIYDIINMQARPLNLRSLIAIVNKVHLTYFTIEIYHYLPLLIRILVFST